MSKKIKRTWITKSGKVKTKVYDYSTPSRKGKTLVSPKGRKYYKNINELKAKIRADDTLTEGEKRALLTDVDATTKLFAGQGKKLTSTGFFGMTAGSRLERMFMNAGYSPEEAAAEIGVDVNEILNEKNWSGEQFSFGGVIYAFKFRYSGSIFEVV